MSGTVNYTDVMSIRNEILLQDGEFRKLSSFIYDNYGINLPVSKRTLLESRLQKRLRHLKFDSFKEYVKWVTQGEEHEEVVEMINIVSTNKTDFFREKPHFDYLQNRALPSLLTRPSQHLKIWSAASSTGEEIYTIGMTLEEYKKQHKTKFDYSILGTDISTEVLSKARDAVYTADRIATIPLELKRQYFLKSKNPKNLNVRVVKELRDKAQFRRFNLMSNRFPTTNSFDIIFCRNVLIYFDRPTQIRIIKKLVDCLKPGGYFFLGHSESIMGIDVPLKQIVHTGYQKITS